MREVARAKVNLALHVLGRRPDGYHDIDTLVAFAETADEISAEKRLGDFALTIDGPFSDALAAEPDRNLVMRAAKALGAAAGGRRDFQLRLTKNVPVAAGLGGGSADAAATLRLLGREWRFAALEPIAARLGADVPMCLESRPLRATGKGEKLAAVAGLPDLPLVLAYPGVPISTAEVFAGHSGVFDPAMPALPGRFETVADVTRWLRRTRNSLEDVARLKEPVIAGVLQALAAAPGAMMSRMSGSGSTCFGIFPFPEAAEHAARMIQAAEPDWWVVATVARGSPREKSR